jgi:hypothetical protein
VTKASTQPMVAAVVALAAIAGISVMQAPLATRVHTVKQRDDVFAMPSARYIVPMSLGYRAAAADLVWAKLLLEYSNHWADKKYFREAPLFIDDIIALDSTHKTIYRFVDTILIYQPTETNTSRGDIDDCRAARHYLEVGLQNHPYDGELWLHYGQFIAFMGPAYLTDRDEIEQWRVDGAKAIARSMDLGIKVDRTGAAWSILNRSGQRKAAIAVLEHAIALSDDPEEREKYAAQLQALTNEAREDEGLKFVKGVETNLRKSYPYMSRGLALILTPAPNPNACAGPDRAMTSDCLTSWAAVEQASH